MVGINVKEPENECHDPNCPFHGELPVRGQVIEGIVTSDKADRTITVERSFYKFIKKFVELWRKNKKLRKKLHSFLKDVICCYSFPAGSSILPFAECDSARRKAMPQALLKAEKSYIL